MQSDIQWYPENHLKMSDSNLDRRDHVGVIIWDDDIKEYNLSFILDKPNTSLTIYGIFLGNKDRSCEINLNVTHKAVNTKSRLVLKGVLADKSSVKFKGNTRIEKGAKGTDAWLECRLLILSKQANGQAIPGLEILENDIKAGHASTAGRINDLEMFYLQSRGLSEKTAKKLIVEGFLETVVYQMPQIAQSFFFNSIKNFNYE